jgi:hypothetical protein
MTQNGIDADCLLHRTIPLDSELPWQVIDPGVSTAFLRRDYEAAHRAELVPTCREAGCHACGIQDLMKPCPTLLLRHSDTI